MTYMLTQNTDIWNAMNYVPLPSSVVVAPAHQSTIPRISCAMKQHLLVQRRRLRGFSSRQSAAHGDSEPRSLRSFRASAPASAVTLVQQRSTRCDLGPSLPYTIVINCMVEGAAVTAAIALLAVTMRIAGSKALLEITGGDWGGSVGGNNTRERTTFAVGS